MNLQLSNTSSALKSRAPSIYTGTLCRVASPQISSILFFEMTNPLFRSISIRRRLQHCTWHPAWYWSAVSQYLSEHQLSASPSLLKEYLLCFLGVGVKITSLCPLPLTSEVDRLKYRFRERIRIFAAYEGTHPPNFRAMNVDAIPVKDKIGVPQYTDALFRGFLVHSYR